MEHKHRAKTSETRAFTGPVANGARENRAAHGGHTRRETCSCGATRRVNVNGSYVEWGEWKEVVD